MGASTASKEPVLPTQEGPPIGPACVYDILCHGKRSPWARVADASVTRTSNLLHRVEVPGAGRVSNPLDPASCYM